MPVSVSTGSLGEPRAKRCKHCDESSHRNESGSGYWQLQLDRDLVDTISAIYPEWFKTNMAEGGTPPRESPPKAVVDTSPLLNSLEQNKESLKVKLMLRRPVEQLVDQGIMPPLKTPGAFHGQRRQLERAKTGDLLKSKIQQRPSRGELESRHILEPDPHVDPSLADKQRKLKKARLADQLNDQLSHRPGPLELIRKNILHTEEPIEHAVKAGHIPYRATCEGQLNRPQHPLSYVTPEEDSQSSEDNSTSPGPADVLETAAKSAGIVVSLIPAGAEQRLVVATATPVIALPVPVSVGVGVHTTTASATIPTGPVKTDNSDIVFADFCRAGALLSQVSASSPASLVSSTSTLSPLSSIASPGPSIISQPATPGPPLAVTPRPITTVAPPPVRTDAPGKDKNRKKSKSKAVPKARTIKFHEYKGPPNAQKAAANAFTAGAQGESSYELMLQQQQLLLQYQLQLHNKSSKQCLILPAAQKAVADAQNNTGSNGVVVQTTAAVVAAAASTPLPPATNRLLGRLEDMKVTDLKAELKRRSLPVSGSKPQLIERLKPFTAATQPAPVVVQNQNTSSTSCDSIREEIDLSHNSPLHSVDMSSPQTIATDEQSEHMDVSECEPPSPAMSLHDTPESQEVINLQQRRIEELERQLKLSKMKLEAATRAENKASYMQLLERIQALQESQQNAEEQQKLQEQQQQQQEQHVAFQNQKNLAGSLVLNGNDATLVLNHISSDKLKLINGHNRSNSLPNFFQSLVQPHAVIKEDVEMKSPPALYDETAIMKVERRKKEALKSQDVEDVLDILIQSGELPASAAQDALTPNTLNAAIKSEPIFLPASPYVNHVVNSPQHQPFQHMQQQQHHHLDPTDSILSLDPNEILNHLDLDCIDFMELCGQSLHGNNNTTNAAATVVDNVHAGDVVMETDEWLDLLQGASVVVDNNGYVAGSSSPPPPSALTNNNLPDITPSQELGYDPLIAIGQNPLDPFNLDEFRSPSDLTAALSWDRLDFAA